MNVISWLFQNGRLLIQDIFWDHLKKVFLNWITSTGIELYKSFSNKKKLDNLVDQEPIFLKDWQYINHIMQYKFLDKYSNDNFKSPNFINIFYKYK